MFLKECEKHFNSKCLYEILSVEKDCTAAELKKGYYRQSMKWHPDKASLSDENDETKDLHTVRFQILNKAYSILSDKERRPIYDETGSVDDEETELNEDVLYAWRKIFKKVTKEDIDNYMKEYQGSQEQKDELIAAYNKYNGNFDKIMEYVIGYDDVQLLKTDLDKLIEEGVIKSTKKYESSFTKKKENSRKAKAGREAKEAEAILKEIQKKESATSSAADTSLEAMILVRNSKRAAQNDSFLDSLAAKYSSKKSKKK